MMKPLPTAPLTQEDIDVWLRIESRFGPGTRYHALTHADRRDADLMLQLAGWRHPQTAQCIQRMTEWYDRELLLMGGRPAW
jgi:hypothetical protein